MHWRDDPRGKSATHGAKPAWPRNGAVMKGIVHVLEKPVQQNLKWLEVTEYQAAGDSKFVPCAGAGCWMQFDQGGPLLHEKK
mmetsp:Transcript_105510/g.169802  ORF Transcript_105510/g.169802 Transcript_105510/m.169802 type:complete len:82 (+) Transcript_105510:84-329(+)